MSKRNRIGPANPMFKTGKYIDAQGYVVLSSKVWGRNVGRREHQVVAEAKIGRPLRRGEVVHHKNGVRADNRPENLEVLTRRSHPREHGAGCLLACCACGKTRWYSPYSLARMTTLNGRYKCRPCALSSTYTKACKRCGGTFDGGMQSQYCGHCTRKNKR